MPEEKDIKLTPRDKRLMLCCLARHEVRLTNIIEEAFEKGHNDNFPGLDSVLAEEQLAHTRYLFAKLK